MRRSMTVAVLLSLATGSTVANAADYGALPYASAAQGPSPIVELGTGWYLRGDVGGGFETQVQLNPDIPVASNKLAWTGDIGVGYKLNEYLRTDFTLDYLSPQHVNATNSKTSICPYTLQGLSSQAGDPRFSAVTNLGYLYSPQAGTCSSGGTADLYQATAFANIYGDLGTYFGITPYVGGGVGVARVQYKAVSNYYKTSDGSIYAADLTPTGTGSYPLQWIDIYGYSINPQPKNPLGQPLAFGKQNYLTTVNKTSYAVAFNLTGGFAYNITDHAAIDVNYRYINNGTYLSLPGNNSPAIKKALETQQVRVGFRYLID